MKNLILIDVSGSMREDEILNKINDLINNHNLNVADILTFDNSINSIQKDVQLKNYEFKIKYAVGGTDLTEVDNFLNQNQYSNKYIISDFELNYWDLAVVDKHQLTKIYVR